MRRTHRLLYGQYLLEESFLNRPPVACPCPEHLPCSDRPHTGKAYRHRYPPWNRHHHTDAHRQAASVSLSLTLSCRAKSAGSLCISSVSALPPSETPAPRCLVVLRHLLLNTYKGQGCHCSTRLPVLSDLELELFLGGPWTRQGQVLVVYVTSSVSPPPRGKSVELVLQKIHHKQVSTSAMPCAKVRRRGVQAAYIDVSPMLYQSSAPLTS